MIPDVRLSSEHDIFALDSTSISCSIKLMSWALGKYERGAVKMHTLLDLRGSIPTFIHITHGKWHDSNMLDIMEIIPNAVIREGGNRYNKLNGRGDTRGLLFVFSKNII